MSDIETSALVAEDNELYVAIFVTSDNRTIPCVIDVLPKHKIPELVAKWDGVIVHDSDLNCYEENDCLVLGSIFDIENILIAYKTYCADYHIRKPYLMDSTSGYLFFIKKDNCTVLDILKQIHIY